MIKKTLIYWRDIPAQVVVQRGRTREKMLLSARFQTAIDRAAMRAGKGGSDAYLAEWRHVSSTVDPSDSSILKAADGLRELAEREAARLEAEYSDDALARLVRSHGLAQPDTDTDSDTDTDTDAAAAARENRQ